MMGRPSHGADNLMLVFTDKTLRIPEPMRQSMTYERGEDVAMHKELSKRTCFRLTSLIHTVISIAVQARALMDW